jgi:arylsulfatase A
MPLLISFLLLVSVAVASAAERPPNVVIIFADDMGYGDIGPFGAKRYATPHLDALARGGRKFTSFYVAQPVCSASRAALLTGCYPNRVGIQGALGPASKIGIHSNETTIAELVKPKGYATAIYGKWHLGHRPEFLPTRHGFDEYFGLPYSNDMWPRHPEAPKGTYPNLPLIDGDRVIESKPDQRQLTKAYTERAVNFIDRNKEKPFLLYLAHSMPHVPIFVSETFPRSNAGLYADVIREIDWSVGEVIDALRKNGLESNTLVVFTSDNGPWLSYGNHAGSAGELREGKGTVWEGGVRVPCVMSWPGKIPAGTSCDEATMTIDLLPTVASLTGAELPGRKIDGRNIWPLVEGKSNLNPRHPYFFYYNANDLLAVRQGDWKLYVPQPYRSLAGRPGGTNGMPAKYESVTTDLALHNLRVDIGEKHNVAGEHPTVVTELSALLATMRRDLGDARTQENGGGRRAAGKIDE